MSDYISHEQSLRLAAELVLGDEALTNNLADPEAEVLLQWALAAARRATSTCTSPGQPANRDRVIEAVHPVRTIAQSINELVAEYQDLSEAEFIGRLLSLVELAGHVLPAGSAPIASSFSQKSARQCRA